MQIKRQTRAKPPPTSIAMNTPPASRGSCVSRHEGSRGALMAHCKRFSWQDSSIRVRSHGNTQGGIPGCEQELAPNLSGRAAAAAGAGRADAHRSTCLVSAPQPAAIRRPGRQGHIPAAKSPPSQTLPCPDAPEQQSRAEPPCASPLCTIAAVIHGHKDIAKTPSANRARF